MPYPTEETVYDSICWSADVPDARALRSKLKEMPKLRWVKIDQLFTKQHGFEIIDQLSADGYNVFSDEKLTEIGSKLEAIARVIVTHGPAMLNCMAGNLSTGLILAEDPETIDSLKRFADVCLTAGVKPCAVTVLTNVTPEIAQVVYGRSVLEQVMFFVGVLDKCGFTDIVCSNNELPAVSAEFPHIASNVLAIRPAGSSAGDQARIGTPVGALKAGAKRLVIGRPITNGNSAQNLENIVVEILSGQGETQ